jgi:hypothetical protein
MSEADTAPREGGCRCGRVRFRVTAPALLASVCHCRGCQLMTASAFSTTLTVPADGFEVTAGEPVIGGLHGPHPLHHHCDWCKSWVFTRTVPEMGFVNVRATQLDDTADFVPYVEMFTDERLPWAVTGAVRSYPRFPEDADYPGLVADYAAFVRDGRAA